MNEIIKQLIDWCCEEKYTIAISLYEYMNTSYLRLTLGRGRKKISHEFYIGDDILSIQNWKDERCDFELKYFLQQARKELK